MLRYLTHDASVKSHRVTVSVQNSSVYAPSTIFFPSTVLMNAVATVFPETYTMLCYFHIGKNVRAKCITDCKVKPKPPKDAKVDKKQVKNDKEKNRDVVEKIVSAWRVMYLDAH